MSEGRISKSRALPGGRIILPALRFECAKIETLFLSQWLHETRRARMIWLIVGLVYYTSGTLLTIAFDTAGSAELIARLAAKRCLLLHDLSRRQPIGGT